MLTGGVRFARWILNSTRSSQAIAGGITEIVRISAIRPKCLCLDSPTHQSTPDFWSVFTNTITMSTSRTATVERVTGETQITCTIDLDHTPGVTKQVIEVSTGIGFLDHVSKGPGTAQRRGRREVRSNSSRHSDDSKHVELSLTADVHCAGQTRRHVAHAQLQG